MGGHKRTRPVTAWWCHSHSCGLALSPNPHSRAFLSCGPTGSKGRVQLSRHVALSMSSTGWHVRAGCASPGRCPHATCSSPWEKWGPLCLAWDPALGSFFSPVFPSACPACASGGCRWGAGGLVSPGWQAEQRSFPCLQARCVGPACISAPCPPAAVGSFGRGPPALVKALQSRSRPILSMESLPLSWPESHHLPSPVMSISHPLHLGIAQRPEKYLLKCHNGQKHRHGELLIHGPKWNPCACFSDPLCVCLAFT